MPSNLEISFGPNTLQVKTFLGIFGAREMWTRQLFQDCSGSQTGFTQVLLACKAMNSAGLHSYPLRRAWFRAFGMADRTIWRATEEAYLASNGDVRVEWIATARLRAGTAIRAIVVQNALDSDLLTVALQPFINALQSRSVGPRTEFSPASRTTTAEALTAIIAHGPLAEHDTTK